MKLLETYKNQYLKEEETKEIKEFVNDIEKTIKKYFKNSTLDVKYSTNLLESIWIYFAIGEKKYWSYGYADNSPVNVKCSIYKATENSNFLEKMEFKPQISKIYIKPENPQYMEYDSVKIPARKATGNKDKILNTIDKLFSNVKKLTKENIPNFKDEHSWIKKYI